MKRRLITATETPPRPQRYRPPGGPGVLWGSIVLVATLDGAIGFCERLMMWLAQA